MTLKTRIKTDKLGAKDDNAPFLSLWETINGYKVNFFPKGVLNNEVVRFNFKEKENALNCYFGFLSNEKEVKNG